MKNNLKFGLLCTIAILSMLCNMSYAHTKAQVLNLDILKSIRTSASPATYDFIILMKQLFIDEEQLIIDQTLLPAASNKIRYYYTDCSDKKLLTHCQPGRNVPIIVVYKRVIIQYEKGWGNKNQIISKDTDQIDNMKDNVKKWVSQVMSASVYKDIKDRKTIDNMIKDNRSIYIMVNNKTLGQNQLAFDIIAKSFPYEKFIYYTSHKISQTLDLNLTQGKFIHLTYDHTNNQFPVVNTPKFQHWKSFVQNQLFWGIQPLSAQLTSDRFNLTKLFNQERKTVIFCDLTFECINFMKRLNQEIIEAKGNGQNVVVMKNIVESQSLKNPKIFQLYYHIKLYAARMPAILVIDGKDKNYENLPARYLRELALQQSPLASIKSIWAKIDNNEQKTQYLSSGIPKKNGYYGKGSEKHIQKLSFETYKKAILQQNKQNALYLLYITAFDFQCQQCQQSYSELKKFASYIIADGWTNVKFGVLDLSKNQIDLSSIEGIPSLMYFKPGSIDPVTLKDKNDNEEIVIFKARFNFDSLLRVTTEIKSKLNVEGNGKQEL